MNELVGKIVQLQPYFPGGTFLLVNYVCKV